MNTSDPKKKIAVCETQPVTAEGLRAAVGAEEGLQVVAATSTLEDALLSLQAHSPDVLLVDKTFGLQPVAEFIGKLRESFPAIATVVWGPTLSEAEALRLLQVGAKGILRKTAAIESVAACIRTVAGGTTWMEDSIFREVTRPERYPRSELTPREHQVLELVEQGMKNKDIGRELGIRPGTVKIHLKHIFEKTGVRGRYGLALSGLKDKGMISLMTV